MIVFLNLINIGEILSSLRLDFHSLYTFYRRVQGYPCRGILLASLVFMTLHEVSSIFLLSVICTESSSTSSAGILKVSSQ